MGELARKALKAIQEQGGRVINHDLIDTTLRQIGQEYKPGLIRWIRSQPDRWARLLELETQINQAALCKDEGKLESVLLEYQSFFLRMGEDFQKLSRKGGDMNGQDFYS